MRLQESKKVTLLAEASHYTTQWSGLAGWIIIWVQKRTRFLHPPPPKSGFQWCSFCHFQVSFLVPTVLSWARDPHKVQSEEATLTSECQTNPQPATFHPPRWAVNLSCNIAEGVLCTTTQTPDFTDQELRDRELLCSGFVSSTITVTLLWETVNNQSRLRSFVVRSENGACHKSVAEVTEENLGFQQLQGSCQNVGTSTRAEKMLALNGNSPVKSLHATPNDIPEGKNASQEYQPHKVVYNGLGGFSFCFY